MSQEGGDAGAAEVRPPVAAEFEKPKDGKVIRL